MQRINSLQLKSPVIIFATCVICLLCIISAAEAKSVPVHARKPDIRRSPSPHVIQRKRLKLAKHPVRSDLNSLSSISLLKRNEKGTMPQTPTGIIGSGADPIETTFNTGFKRLFNFLGGLSSSPENHGESEDQETNLKLPTFFPSTSPFPTYDLTSLIKLIENMDDAQIEQLAESAFVDSLSQLIGIIGINDLRDWVGLIIAYFLLGPVFVPLFWLPVSVYIMIGLLTPLFLFNPPSKLNEGPLGHDPIEPDVLPANGEMARRMLELESEDKNSSNLITMNQTRIPEFETLSIVETCLEHLSCQITRISRDNPVSNWLTDRLNATKVEWARMLLSPEETEEDAGRLQLREDCNKYKCSIIFPSQVRRFISFWTS